MVSRRGRNRPLIPATRHRPSTRMTLTMEADVFCTGHNSDALIFTAYINTVSCN